MLPNMAVRFVLNGKPAHVGEVDPHLNLLTWLRQAGWTGSKEGCAEGECGACAVAFVEQDDDHVSRLVPVNSCLVPVAAVAGRSVVTVEGVADPDGTLHPVQKALVEAGGSQCGYCTPGFVVSMFCEYHRPDREGFDPESIAGNLCRCTGYRPIRDAARSLAHARPSSTSLARFDPRLPILDQPIHMNESAPPARFVRLSSLHEAMAALGGTPGARLVAGGTDLMVDVNQRDVRAPLLVSLEGLAELQGLRWTDQGAELGAGVSLSKIEHWLSARSSPRSGALALFTQMLPLFASPLIRNRATLGGSLATASPIGDLAPVLLALDAELVLASPRGERSVRISDFFLGYRQSVLARDEILLRALVPAISTSVARHKFYKVSKRVLDDISTVAAAFVLELGAHGHVERLRIAYAGVAATPLRAQAAEQAALGKPWNAATQAEVLRELRTVGTPIDDRRGSAAYRKAMITRLFERFCAEPFTEQP